MGSLRRRHSILKTQLCLLYTAEQRGRVYGVQLTKETGSADLGRCSLCRGVVFRLLAMFLRALSTFTLGPEEDSALS